MDPQTIIFGRDTYLDMFEAPKKLYDNIIDQSVIFGTLKTSFQSRVYQNTLEYPLFTLLPRMTFTPKK